jgi:hypothetical protein
MSEEGRCKACGVDGGCFCDIDIYTMLKRVQRAEQDVRELRREIAGLKEECAKRCTDPCNHCGKVATQEASRVCHACRQGFMKLHETSPFSATRRIEMEEIK